MNKDKDIKALHEAVALLRREITELGSKIEILKVRDTQLLVMINEYSTHISRLEHNLRKKD